MFYTQNLNSMNNFINRLSLFKKVILYLMPLLFLILFFYFFRNDSLQKSSYSTPIVNIKSKIETLNKKMNHKANILKVLNDIESFAKKNNINIISLKQNKKILDIQFIGNEENIIKFVQYCEYFHNFSKIEQLLIKQSDALLKNIQMKVSFDTFYYKKKRLKTEQTVEYQLSAIVGNYALINNIWLTLNQKINEYKIIAIGVNTVDLNNSISNTKIKLKLYDETK